MIDKALNKFEVVFMIVSATILVVVVFWQVICRYFLYIPTPWAEELARYMFIALTFIGAGYCTSKREHIEIAIMDNLCMKTKNPRKMMYILFIISTALGLVFLLLFANLYMDYLSQIAYFGQTSPSLRINMLIPMSSVMIGVILMIFHSVVLFFKIRKEDIVLIESYKE